MKSLFLIVSWSFCFISLAQQAATWEQVHTPTSKDLYCIDFPSAQVGYIGGADSVLLKTTDGGQTWNKVSYTGITFFPEGDDFMEIDFITDSIGYATIGPYTGTYRTADGGQTWILLNTTLSLCFNHALYFFADGHGFVGGSGCFQGEQMDRFVLPGNSSQVNIPSTSLNSTNRIIDMDFDLDQMASVGLAVSTGGRILRTTDGGNNWDTIQSPLGNQVKLTTVTIVNSHLAYIGYDNGNNGMALLVSTDGGLTWSFDSHSATFAYPVFHDLHTTQSDRVYCGTTATSLNAGYILELIDAQAASPTWIGYSVNEPIYSMSSYLDTIVWGAGKNGFLVKRGPADILSVNKGELNMHVEVYPNPGNNSIQVNLPDELKRTGFHLELYSMEGKLLKKEASTKGEMNIADLENGTYLIRVIGEKDVWVSTFLKQ
ncbi:MAG: YCF48-related protein [Cytophagaceae bacterium]|jgi:photosystem II stability/assembly factor-like uncharacterized protein|nr:YCF48-related protein [Cytophagaceae bacterium]